MVVMPETNFDKHERYTKMKNDIYLDDGKRMRYCAVCGKMFEVDFFNEHALFCSDKCESQGGFAYVKVKRDGNVEVVKCDAGIVTADDIRGVIGGDVNVCDVSDIAKGYNSLPFALTQSLRYGDVIDHGRLNERASKVFDAIVVGDCVVVNGYADGTNAGYASFTENLANVIAERIRKSDKNESLVMPIRVPFPADDE